MPKPRIVVYTRPGCHLCEVALATLAQRHLRATEVNVDDQPELVERFGNCVPVVEIDGKVRFRGQLPPLLLDRLIAASGW